MKERVCCHLVGLSNTHGLDLYICKYNKRVKNDKFVTKTNKGRKRGKPLYGKACQI